MQEVEEPTLIQEYHPELLPRRGEAVSWTLAILAGIFLLVFQFLLIPIPVWMILIFFLFLFSALIISLGNWMDRSTVLWFTYNEIGYKDGIRKIQLTWGELDRVEVYSSTFGEKVSVIGQARRFNFRLMGEVKLRGETKGRLGFKDGEMILKTILEKSRLFRLETNGGNRYYSR